MGNIFDSLQNTLFNVVTATMGYDAQWLNSQLGDFDAKDFKPADFDTFSDALVTGKVLYKGPTEKEKLLDADFDPEKVYMEYKQGDFTGLFEAVRQNRFEPVRIVDIGYFKVRSISKHWDGKTLIAILKYIP